MRDGTADLRPSNFPDDLKWTPDDGINSLQRLHQFVLEECSYAIQWYFARKRLKRILGYVFRSGAILLFGVSTVIPILSEMYKTNNISDISPMWATIAIILAGVLIGFDRFGGWTSGWIRYIQTAQALSKLQSDFSIEWEKFRMQLNGGKSDTAILVEGIEKCREFLEKVHSGVSAETNLGRSGRMTLWCSKKRIHWMHRLLRENWDRRNGEFAVARNFGLLLCPRVVATTS